MKKQFCAVSAFAVLFCLLSIGCDAKFDSSSREKADSSARKVVKGMSDARFIEFTAAMMAYSYMNNGVDALTSKDIHGKTAQQFIDFVRERHPKEYQRMYNDLKDLRPEDLKLLREQADRVK